MKTLIAFFSFAAIGIVLCTLMVPDGFVSDFEKTAVYSFCLLGEREEEEAFSRSERAEKESVILFDELTPGNGETLSAEKKETDEHPTYVLLQGGTFRFVFDSEFSDLFVHCVENKLKDRMRVGNGIDYRNFAFIDRMYPMTEPMSDQEVSYVFYKIVRSCTSQVPIHGVLEEITFLREENQLLVRAVISISFEAIAAHYHLYILPPSATFDIRVPFFIEKSEISADIDKINVSCKEGFLSETLLIFACNAAFGKKDYRALFGGALENVFINAGIYG